MMESCAVGVSFFMRPGRRKVAGETLFDAWMPLQPAAPNASKAVSAPSRMHFQFQATGGTIEVNMVLATKISGRFVFMIPSTLRAALCCVRVLMRGKAADALAIRAGAFPSPQPSPLGRGSHEFRASTNPCSFLVERLRSILPLPQGEGKGRSGTPMRVLLAGILTLASFSHAADFPARAQHDYQSALDEWRLRPASVTAAVAVARAAFLHAEFVTRDDPRAEIARRGIDAARDVIARDPNNAAARYWLAMDLGQLARTKSLGALPLVKEIARELLHARDLDEHTDYAGPNRSLGLLYRDAPGWPTSIGDKTRARDHLLRAVKTHPEFPENQICLLESYEQWGDRDHFDEQLRTTERVMNEARAKFTGDEWAFNWSDWEKRFASAKAKAAKVGRSTHPKGAK